MSQVLLRHLPYYGSPNTRIIPKDDGGNLDGLTDLVWEPSNRHTVEMSEKAAEHLINIEPNDWQVVESANERTQSTSGVVKETTTDSVKTEAPQGRLIGSKS